MKPLCAFHKIYGTVKRVVAITTLEISVSVVAVGSSNDQLCQFTDMGGFCHLQFSSQSNFFCCRELLGFKCYKNFNATLRNIPVIL